jgi:cytochrome bd-type quinol oxidase subunit 1
MTTTPPDQRPRSVDVALWLLVIGSVLLLAGGLLALTVSFSSARQMVDPALSDDVVHQLLRFNRIAGAVCVVAGLILGWLTGKLRRSRDPRFRRAVIALAMAIGVVVAMLAVVAGSHLLTLIALLPIIVGAMVLTRPAATEWFGGVPQDPADD